MDSRLIGARDYAAEPSLCLPQEVLKKRLHKAALADLEQHLKGDECAVIVIEGISGQAIIITNQHRALVFKKGIGSGVGFGGQAMHSFGFSEIHGVQVKAGRMSGHVALEMSASDVEGFSYWSDDAFRRSRNAISIDKSLEPQALEGAGRLRVMLHQYRISHSSPSAPISAPLSTARSDPDSDALTTTSEETALVNRPSYSETAQAPLPVTAEPQRFGEALEVNNMATLSATGRKTADERKAILARTIATEMARGNMRVESQGDFNAILVKGKPTRHLLHLILSIITLSWWILIWIPVAIFGGEKRRMIIVDEYGNTSNQKV